MPTTQTFVLAGGGLAGAKAAESLREQGFDGQLVLIGDEDHRPYERPPLSKSYLAGSTDREEVFVQAEQWYSANQVELRLGQSVTSVDSAAHRVEIADGTSIRYDKLLLATGSAPRRLDVPGSDARGVHYLRRLEDSELLKGVIGAGARVAIVGAGWIGLEVAAAARQADLEVTVIEAAEQPLLRVLGPEVARVFADLHRDHGVDLRLASGVSEILTHGGNVRGIRLADGSDVEAEAVVVGVGIKPNVELAERASLRTDNGVLVDQHLCTSDPDIFAAGDVANAWHPFYDKHIRVEHWANALNQPAVAATGMLGRDASYSELPYFYTDQYDLGMEYVGYVEPNGYDEVVFRGDVAGREFIAFWLKDRRVLAGMNVNVWDVTEPIKALIRSREPVDPARLSDADRSLEDLVDSD
ncbi:MAG: FAD-dependent oxidoreductase [Actinomycetota bacterium]